MKVIKNIGIKGLPVYDRVSNTAAEKKVKTGMYRYSAKQKYKSVLNRGNELLELLVQPGEVFETNIADAAAVYNEHIKQWTGESMFSKLLSFIRNLFAKIKNKFI